MYLSFGRPRIISAKTQINRLNSIFRNDTGNVTILKVFGTKGKFLNTVVDYLKKK